MKQNEHMESLLKLALREDMAEVGDLTSLYFVPAEATGQARIFAKDDGIVLSGVEVAAQVLEFSNHLVVGRKQEDGNRVGNGETILEISGPLREILTMERIALNFLQRLAGVATLTGRFADAVKGTGVKLLDTRKTTPGWRALEKAAVVHGGGTNHRMGLFDAVMVKDNHLMAENRLEAMAESIDRLRVDHPSVWVELEVDNLDQLAMYLPLEGVRRFLLDNMTLEELRKAVAMRDESKPEIELEASGGVSLETVRSIAETGVDCISVGALTHSAQAVDVSLEILG